MPVLRQKYDHNVEKGFPVLRAILDAAKMWREEGKLPADWAGALERCAGWKHATHPGAWSLIEDFEGQFGHDQVPPSQSRDPVGPDLQNKKNTGSCLEIR